MLEELCSIRVVQKRGPGRNRHSLSHSRSQHALGLWNLWTLKYLQQSKDLADWFLFLGEISKPTSTTVGVVWRISANEVE